MLATKKKNAKKRAQPTKKLGGRPRGGTVYKPEYADIAEAAAADLGATDAQLARLFNVSRQTINNWKTEHPDFVDALDRGKAEADDRVERSLYQRAIGFDYTEKKTTDGGIKTEVTTYERRAIGDVTAQIKWLTNRRPNRWRVVPEGTDENDTPAMPIAISIVAYCSRIKNPASASCRNCAKFNVCTNDDRGGTVTETKIEDAATAEGLANIIEAMPN